MLKKSLKDGEFMSELQLQAVNMIDNMSDDNIMIVINFMKSLKNDNNLSKKKIALEKMKSLQKETANYFDANFDPDKARQIAMEEKYGRIS